MIKITLNQESLNRLRQMPGLMVPAIFKGMKEAMFTAERYAKEALSGRVLQRRTGRLRSSIATESKIAGDLVTGTIGSNVVYARIHELGGEIRPKTKKALKFQIPGVGWRTAQKVVMPERPYLRPSLEGHLAEYEKLFVRNVEEAFNK